MRLKLKIKPEDMGDVIPPDEVLADAASYAMMELVARHLSDRNGSHANRRGFPRSDYWQDASESVHRSHRGKTAEIEIDKEGVALHYEGGTVLPKNGGRALAIPLAAEIYGKRPSEWSGFNRGDESDSDDVLQMFWPKGSPHGFLKDRDSSELLYLLVPRANIHADKTVLPTEDEFIDAVREAIL